MGAVVRRTPQPGDVVEIAECACTACGRRGEWTRATVVRVECPWDVDYVTARTDSGDVRSRLLSGEDWRWPAVA